MSDNNNNNLPPPPPPPHSNFTLFSIMQKEKLNGANYLDWLRNLRIALRYEDKEYVLDEDLPLVDDNSPQEEIDAYNRHDKDSVKVACIMLGSMVPELQKSFENLGAYEMNESLSDMFREQARTARYSIVQELISCK